MDALNEPIATIDDQESLFDIIHSTRAIKRLKPDPVPHEMLRKVLNAGTQAPSGFNSQPWSFVVIEEAHTKRFIRDRYLAETRALFQEQRDAERHENTAQARLLRTIFHLAEHLDDVPVLLLVCGKRDWPFWFTKEERTGEAPPPYGAIFPCVQNILLACRALGLGASLTTIHRRFEHELARFTGVPHDQSIVAMLPIGFPAGKFGPLRRTAAEIITHHDRWGHQLWQSLEPLAGTSKW